MTEELPPDDPVTAYAKAVGRGEIVAGPYVRAACERHLNDLAVAAERGLRFDVEAVERVIRFFRALTIESKTIGTDGGVQSRVVPFILQPWQCFIVGSLMGWKNDEGVRRFRRAYVEIGKGAGKALALDTPIATPTGWREMRDLQPGDLVFDETGKPCRVTGATPAMFDRPCYRVTFSDGAEIVADADHLWVTTALRSGGKRGPKPVSAPRKAQPWLRTTREIAATLRMKASPSVYPQAKWNHRVDIAGALQLPEAALPIPPYTLGVWLGDGDSNAARITVAVADWQIVDGIVDEGVPVVEQGRHAPHIARVSLSGGRGGARYDGLPASVLATAVRSRTVTAPDLVRATRRDADRIRGFLSDSGLFDKVSAVQGLGGGGGARPAVWKINARGRAAARVAAARPAPIGNRLAALGLLNNKHVPAAYLRASRAQRLALLQGLMDSDGHATKRGACEFSVTNEGLAKSALELIHSLGIKAVCRTGSAKLYGVVVGKQYRIGFFPPPGCPVFRLARKLARMRAAPATRPLSRGRMIVGCEPIASVPVRCISVDSPSRMYLAGREMVPTHNSPLAAGLGLYFLAGKGVMIDDGQIYSAATSRDQAYILFRAAIRMFLRSRILNRKLRAKGQKFETISQLTHMVSHSVFKPIASENQGQSGTIVYCALIDEVHEHPDDTVIEMMRAGTKGNQDALLFAITNSGFDKNTVCGREHDYSVRVVTGEEPNDAWFSYVAALDQGEEPFEDESCWIKANPNLGVSIHPAYIREQVAEAKGMPAKEGLVRRLNFCQWTDSESHAIPRELWEAAEAPLDGDALVEGGYRCFGGLDLSRVADLTAFTLTWLLDETKDQWKFATRTWFWSPADTLVERGKKDHSHYDLWAKQGHLEAVSGKLIKMPWIADALLELCAKYRPETIGCDQYGLTQLLDALSDMGQSLPCVVHPQGFNKRVVGKRSGTETGAEEIILWMPDSINKLEAALLERRIQIDINPVMRMCSQAVVYTTNRTGHRMFDKEKATRRIDGMVSLAMSIGVATMRASKPAKSYLATNDLLVL